MRPYELHEASWDRITTHRTRRPNVITTKLRSRRRRARLVPDDGRLVVLAANHTRDPRTGELVGRRELLDRIVEALTFGNLDGVVASADLIEDLTILNMLERRLAICTVMGGESDGVALSTVEQGWFDGACLATSGRRSSGLARDVAALQAAGVPALVDLVAASGNERDEFDTEWRDWIDPLHTATRTLTTGPGLWLTIPAIPGFGALADLTSFPLLIRDTEVPIAPAAWSELFSRHLPITVRGVVVGASALFPLSGSVGEAAMAVAAGVRDAP